MFAWTPGHRNLSGNQVNLAPQEGVLSVMWIDVFCVYTVDTCEILISISILSL